MTVFSWRRFFCWQVCVLADPKPVLILWQNNTVRMPVYSGPRPLILAAKPSSNTSVSQLKNHIKMAKKKHVITNKGGRPRIPEYKKNSIQLHVKVSPSLEAYINEQANARFKGRRSDYMRAALAENWVRELVTPEFNKLLHDLSNMGNNVKYLRDWFFRHGIMPEGNQCQDILNELAIVLEEARHRRQLAEKENAEAMEIHEQKIDRT